MDKILSGLSHDLIAEAHHTCRVQVKMTTMNGSTTFSYIVRGLSDIVNGSIHRPLFHRSWLTGFFFFSRLKTGHVDPASTESSACDLVDAEEPVIWIYYKSKYIRNVCRNLKQGTRPKAFEIVHRNEIRKTTISK
jgi:hypothetical protein